MSHLLDLDKLNSSQNFFLNRANNKEDRSVFAIKHTRKLIEADAQLLANRIALLKQEELRSWKKIEEAKKKASEIYMTKLKIEEKQKEKEARKKEENSQIKDYQKLFTGLRNQHVEKMSIIKTAIQKDRNLKFKETRQQRDVNEAKKKTFEQQVLLSKRSRSQSIKEQEAASRVRLLQYHEEKQKNFKEVHRSEAVWQVKLKKKREAEVFTLEKMEMEMLKKLEEAQGLEKQAYDQVEEALNLSPTRYVEKFVGDTPSSSKGMRRGSISRRATTPLKVVRPSGNNSMVMKKKDMNLSLRAETSHPNRSVTVSKRETRRQEDWIGKDARIEREQRVYGRKGSYSGPGKIISNITSSKTSNLNHSYFEYNKRRTNPFDSGTDTLSRSDVVNIGPHITLDDSSIRRSEEKTEKDLTLGSQRQRKDEILLPSEGNATATATVVNVNVNATATEEGNALKTDEEKKEDTVPVLGEGEKKKAEEKKETTEEVKQEGEKTEEQEQKQETKQETEQK